MSTKTMTASATVSSLLPSDGDPPGTVRALVSVFNNIDLVGDRVMPGAFDETIAKLQAAGKSLPILFSHGGAGGWADGESIVGYAKPEDIQVVAKGLYVKFQLLLGKSELADTVYAMLKERAITEFSIGYRTLPGGERKAADGANELTRVDLVEVSVCYRGVNPATELISVKGDHGPLRPTDGPVRTPSKTAVLNHYLTGEWKGHALHRHVMDVVFKAVLDATDETAQEKADAAVEAWLGAERVRKQHELMQQQQAVIMNTRERGGRLRKAAGEDVEIRINPRTMGVIRGQADVDADQRELNRAIKAAHDREQAQAKAHERVQLARERAKQDAPKVMGQQQT